MPVHISIFIFYASFKMKSDTYICPLRYPVFLIGYSRSINWINSGHGWPTPYTVHNYLGGYEQYSAQFALRVKYLVHCGEAALGIYITRNMSYFI